jgi:hypothetical protein
VIADKYKRKVRKDKGALRVLLELIRFAVALSFAAKPQSSSIQQAQISYGLLRSRLRLRYDSFKSNGQPLY